jgi:hypothetical protein
MCPGDPVWESQDICHSHQTGDEGNWRVSPHLYVSLILRSQLSRHVSSRDVTVVWLSSTKLPTILWENVELHLSNFPWAHVTWQYCEDVSCVVRNFTESTNLQVYYEINFILTHCVPRHTLEYGSALVVLILSHPRVRHHVLSLNPCHTLECDNKCVLELCCDSAEFQ